MIVQIQKIGVPGEPLLGLFQEQTRHRTIRENACTSAGAKPE